MDKIKNVFEMTLFLGLTLGLYGLMAVTLPLFEDSQGLLIMTDWADISRSGSIHLLLFASAAACVLLGTLLMEWVPSITPGLMANLWSLTYFFIWIDAVFFLCLENHSARYLYALGLGVLFIYVFFLLIHFHAPQGAGPSLVEGWKPKVIGQWFWGWMGFYFGLSCLMAYDSLGGQSTRMPLAYGAMALCFFNYLLCLWLKKSGTPDGALFSLAGRRFFTAWFSMLTLLWVAERFFGM